MKFCLVKMSATGHDCTCLQSSFWVAEAGRVLKVWDQSAGCGYLSQEWKFLSSWKAIIRSFTSVWWVILDVSMTQPQLRNRLQAVFLIADWYRKTQPTAVNTTKQVGLGYAWKVTGHETRSKPVSSTALWSLLQLLPPGCYFTSSNDGL